MLSLLLADRVDAPTEVDGMGQARGPCLRPELEVEGFDALQVGQLRIPVVGVPLQPPYHPRLQALMAERPRARIHGHPPEIVLVLLQRLFADDDIKARGERTEQTASGP